MIRGKGSQGHTVDLVFVLALFCFFAASAFIVIIIGINVYKGTVAGLNEHYTSRTAMTYVEQKVRQNDGAGRIAVGTVGGQPALIIAGTGDGAGTTTYLYAYQGELMELFIKDGTAVVPGQGQTITEVQSFTPSADGSLLDLTITDTSGKTQTTCLKITGTAAGGASS